MAEKGGKGHSLPGKAAKSSLKSTTPNGASAKGKDDGSGKPKKGRKVQFDSEGLGDGIFGFSSGSKADSLLNKLNLGKGGKGDKTGSAAKSSAPKELPPLELRVEQGSNEMKSVLVSALASNGQISDALEMYEEFKQAGCNLEPKAVISLIEHLQSDGQLSRLLKLLEELTDRDFWLDGCYRVLLYSVRFNHLSAAVDLLKQLKDRISNDEMAMEAIFDEVFFSVAEETTLLQMGFDLLQVIKNDLGLAPSRKVLDVLLSACVSTKDMDKSILIWKEYQAADLPYNILSFLRMYQALLASGDLKSARIVLSKMPKDDPHVRLIIQESQTVYAKMASEKKTVKNRKTKGIKHKKSKAKK